MPAPRIAAPPAPAVATRRSHRTRDVLERDTVLDTALVLLLEHGPDRLRLADLARDLGVVPSALHYHFAGGKDEVIAALFDREEQRVLETMAHAMASAGDARTRLLAMATARLENAARLARLHRVEAGAPRAAAHSPAAEIQAYVMQRRQGFLDRERELVARALRGQVTGRGAAHTVDLLAAAFQGALFNVTRTFALTPSARARAMLTELIDVFVVGLEERQGSSRSTTRR